MHQRITELEHVSLFGLLVLFLIGCAEASLPDGPIAIHPDDHVDRQSLGEENESVSGLREEDDEVPDGPWKAGGFTDFEDYGIQDNLEKRRLSFRTDLGKRPAMPLLANQMELREESRENANKRYRNSSRISGKRYTRFRNDLGKRMESRSWSEIPEDKNIADVGRREEAHVPQRPRKMNREKTNHT